MKLRYRIETNDTRLPVSAWLDFPPVSTCASMNVEAYHRGQGGLYGIYDSAGNRVGLDPEED